MENLKENEGFFRTLINKVPANMRFFASDILGIDTPATNKNFTSNQLSIMRDTALNALDNDKLKDNKTYIDYENYPSGESDVSYQDKGVMSLASKMLDDEFQMRTTIGGANVTVDEEGDIILTDKFNFNDAQDINDLEDVKNALIEKRLQSEDRAHRIGQKKSVTYVDLIAPKTVDEKIVKALRAKMSIANTIMDEDWREWI